MAELAALGAVAATAAESAPAWLPYATAAASGGLGFVSAQKSASTTKQISDYNARELERSAAEERASGVRKASEQKLKNDVIESRMRAAAAKSGAGTTEGEGYLDQTSDIAERGRYLSDLDISMGENAAQGLENRAAITRAKGVADADAAKMRGYASLVNAAGDMTNTALKRNPMGFGSYDQGELIDFAADGTSGFSTETYRAPKRKLRYWEG